MILPGRCSIQGIDPANQYLYLLQPGIRYQTVEYAPAGARHQTTGK